MTKKAICRISYFCCAIMAAAMLSPCIPANAQKGLRVGISVRVPIRPMSDVDKSNINSTLVGFLCLVGLAFTLACIYFLYLTVRGFWDWIKSYLRSRQWQEQKLKGFLPIQNVRTSDPEQIKVEVALAKLRKQEWEERTARSTPRQCRKRSAKLR